MTHEKPPAEKEQAENGQLSEAQSGKAAPEGESVERGGTGFLAVMQSVGAAMIGVQSSKNKERDFTQGKPIHFIVGGIVGTLLFLLAIWLLVKYLIATN